MSLGKTIGIPGDQYSTGKGRKRANRAGGTTTAYGAYIVDLATADAASTTVGLGTDNVLAVTTAAIAAGQIVIAQDAIADDARGNFVEGEGVITRILCNGSGTAIVKGDALKPANASAAMVKATVGTDRFHAIALESTTSATGTPLCLLYSSGRR